MRLKLLKEFAQKLQSADTEEQIAEVKRKLETFKTQPLPQDKLTSPFDPAQGKPPARNASASVAGGPPVQNPKNFPG